MLKAIQQLRDVHVARVRGIGHGHPLAQLDLVQRRLAVVRRALHDLESHVPPCSAWKHGAANGLVL